MGSEQVWQVLDMSLAFRLYAEKYAQTVEYNIKLFPSRVVAVPLLNGAQYLGLFSDTNQKLPIYPVKK